MSSREKRFTVRSVDSELIKKLQILSVARDSPMCDIVNEMIKFYLDNYTMDGVPVKNLKVYYESVA